MLTEIQNILLDGEPAPSVLIADPAGRRVFSYQKGWMNGEVEIVWTPGFDASEYNANPYPIITLPLRVSFLQVMITLAKVASGLVRDSELWTEEDDDAVFFAAIGETLYKVPETEAVLELPQRSSSES